jgi:hypothetical protein
MPAPDSTPLGTGIEVVDIKDRQLHIKIGSQHCVGYLFYVYSYRAACPNLWTSP